MIAYYFRLRPFGLLLIIEVFVKMGKLYDMTRGRKARNVGKTSLVMNRFKCFLLTVISLFLYASYSGAPKPKMDNFDPKDIASTSDGKYVVYAMMASNSYRKDDGAHVPLDLVRWISSVRLNIV